MTGKCKLCGKRFTAPDFQHLMEKIRKHRRIEHGGKAKKGSVAVNNPLSPEAIAIISLIAQKVATAIAKRIYKKFEARGKK